MVIGMVFLFVAGLDTTNVYGRSFFYAEFLWLSKYISKKLILN